MSFLYLGFALLTASIFGVLNGNTKTPAEKFFISLDFALAALSFATAIVDELRKLKEKTIKPKG